MKDKGLRGKFIVIDGPDGAGKSTQREMLARRLKDYGLAVVTCRDPGGTEIGDRIRSVLLDHDLSVMDVHCEALLFMASRAQLVGEVIRPAIKACKTVVCDRFVSSTCAYQGAAGFDPQRVIELAKFAIDDCWPDLTILLDVDADAGLDRVGRRPANAGRNRKKEQGQSTLAFEKGSAIPDAMEARSLEFHRRVRQLFREIHDYYPTPVVSVDASASADDVHRGVVEAIDRAFE